MLKYKKHKDRGSDNHAQKPDRKPYVKPNLTEYGHIEKLTQGANTQPGDGASSRRP